jgi:hypothetical protein
MDSINRRVVFIKVTQEASVFFRPLLLISILVLAVSVSNTLYAQNATSGGLTGVVTDPSGALVPEAVTELKDNAKGYPDFRRKPGAACHIKRQAGNCWST